ncbi:MAG TPA: universal stress protein [Noviherbaspirillum sp.]
MDSPTFTVHIDSSRHLAHRVHMAAQLAAVSQAHLVGVASTMMPMPSYMACVGEAAQAALAEYRNRIHRRIEQNFTTFETVAAGIGFTACEKRLVDDDIGAALCLQGRYSDLLIVGKSDADEADDESAILPEFVVMNSGRPVLVCPCSDTHETTGKRCLVAWDGSLESMRAISGSLFILRAAEKAVLAVFNPRIGWGAHGEEPGADMALYLARHGVEVEVDCRHVPRKAGIGEALLEHGAEMNADLIVAGAYGHSHLREIFLGGVTQTLLDKMTMPLLMAH